MTEDTKTKTAAPKAPKTQLHPDCEKALAHMRENLPSPGTKLGLLARRVEAAVRDLDAAAQAYGKEVVVRGVLQGEHRIPISTTIGVSLTVSAKGEKPMVYGFTVGGMLPTDRPEKTFDEFTHSVTVGAPPFQAGHDIPEQSPVTFGKTIEI